MGHITNPVGFRVGRVTSWASSWSSDKYAYANSWLIDLSFQRYFEALFKTLQTLSYKKGFLFSHVRVFLLSTRYLVMVYFYNANVMFLHKGRFFYYWKRLRKVRELSQRSQQLCRVFFKKTLLKSLLFCKPVRRTVRQNKVLSQQWSKIKQYAKKNPFFLVFIRLVFSKRFNQGLLFNIFTDYNYTLNNTLINKRDLLFKNNYGIFNFNKYINVYIQKSVVLL